MRYVSLFLLLFVASTSVAQIIKDKEPAILEVHYMKTWVTDTLENRSYSEDMTLRVGKTAAMFYPPKRMWADSLLQTNFELHEKLYREMNPPGQIEYKPLGGLEREYLFRNIHEGETMVYRKMGGEAYAYTESTETSAWYIQSETKVAASLPRAILEGANGMPGFQPTYPSMKGLGNCSAYPASSWKPTIARSIMPTRLLGFTQKIYYLWA